MIEAFRKLRKVIDDFNPDAVLIWGDDQYENFQEDLVPPLVIHCDDEFNGVEPMTRAPNNRCGEPVDKTWNWKGPRTSPSTSRPNSWSAITRCRTPSNLRTPSTA